MPHSASTERFHRVKEIERAVPRMTDQARRTIVRVEKKIVHFPFQKYFLGHQKPENAKFKPDWKRWSNDKLTLAWLGQSTVLINFYGTWMLTDPVFTERCGIRVGPATVGPRRLVTCPMTPQELPELDLVLLSHAHMDHTDIPSLRALRDSKRITPRTKVIVAANTKAVYGLLKTETVLELDWNQKYVYEKNCTAKDCTTIEAIETRHSGWRMPWHPCRARNERNGMSYNAYLIEKCDDAGELHAIVFGGDTGYIESFRKLGERMNLEGREIDCAIMPIGTYNPWVKAHCNPEQAWQMTQEMNARVIVPIHWNTFTQSSEPRYEPMEWLRSVVQDPNAIALSEHGQTWIGR
ncbi:MAG TPA: MBL fold metallo-hydrolase [Candidatus Kapabacteria bacterium]